LFKIDQFQCGATLRLIGHSKIAQTKSVLSRE